jgi:hypothetical protein
MEDTDIFATVAETGDRAHPKICIVITPASPNYCIGLQLDSLLHNLAIDAGTSPSEAPSFKIVDCSILAPDVPTPALFLLWVTRVNTPGLFSLTCVAEHVRKQMVEGARTVMSIFNDTGEGRDSGDAIAAGTYMAVFKIIDVEKLRCVPVSFSTAEKKAIKEYADISTQQIA